MADNDRETRRNLAAMQTIANAFTGAFCVDKIARDAARAGATVSISRRVEVTTVEIRDGKTVESTIIKEVN